MHQAFSVVVAATPTLTSLKTRREFGTGESDWLRWRVTKARPGVAEEEGARFARAERALEAGITPPISLAPGRISSLVACRSR
ncbi:MAG: hypothetical protein QOC62_3353 [Mycobacterium sp.]|nr:hypothetical protein [Mycobacterium sp.]